MKIKADWTDRESRFLECQQCRLSMLSAASPAPPHAPSADNKVRTFKNAHI